MRTYSIPRQIWRAVNFPLLYLGVQLIVSAIFTFAYGVYMGMQEAISGNPVLDPVALAERIGAGVLRYALLLTLISLIPCLIVFSLVYSRERKREGEPVVKLGALVVVMIFILGIGMQCALLGLLNLVDIYALFPSYEALNNVLQSGGLPLQILTAGLLAPVAEELCFRGLVFSRLKRSLPLWLAVVLQALLFGVIHLNLLQGLYAFMLGVAFALIYHKARNMIAPILAHITVNLSGIVLGTLLENAGRMHFICIGVAGVALTALMALCMAVDPAPGAAQ